MTLEGYYSRRNERDELSADGLRMQFAGEKFMLEALGGREAVFQALSSLRSKGLKIPHCGDRMPDNSYVGWDSDADLNF